jgi:hypothetical protein
VKLFKQTSFTGGEIVGEFLMSIGCPGACGIVPSTERLKLSRLGCTAQRHEREPKDEKQTPC